MSNISGLWSYGLSDGEMFLHLINLIVLFLIIYFCNWYFVLLWELLFVPNIFYCEDLSTNEWKKHIVINMYIHIISCCSVYGVIVNVDPSHSQRLLLSQGASFQLASSVLEWYISTQSSLLLIPPWSGWPICQNLNDSTKNTAWLQHIVYDTLGGLCFTNMSVLTYFFFFSLHPFSRTYSNNTFWDYTYSHTLPCTNVRYCWLELPWLGLCTAVGAFGSTSKR